MAFAHLFSVGYTVLAPPVRTYFAWQGTPTSVLSVNRAEDILHHVSFCTVENAEGPMPVPDFLAGDTVQGAARHLACVLYWSLLGNHILPYRETRRMWGDEDGPPTNEFETRIWLGLSTVLRNRRYRITWHSRVCQPCVDAGCGNCLNQADDCNVFRGPCFRCAAHNLDCPYAEDAEW